MEFAQKGADLATWAVGLYFEQKYKDPVRQARATLEPLLSEPWSRAAVAACAIVLVSLATLAVHYIFFKPAAQIMRWAVWLAFVVGLPASAGCLAWSVPSELLGIA